ncbi:hypothetical protein [Prosthecomicrobium hirschii]|uniref:hypothetical protein n=1 Tax=Prosthecodimorpha hirschii TaxID=665126 RepID=UPI001126091F|nr:hypothetical protein [Prosthecomicrobium hirschii]MCW1840031.1 hypothetical protein [Prosthecomicrobium hirschii]TPQ48294.1 hypothetical protein C2U72_23350 [Prosthecomicrobium hirschii]
MSDNDIFADQQAIAADLDLLEGLLWARATLSERLASASLSRDPDVLDTLRIESMYQFAEFFFLLRARGIEEVEQIEQLADVHNAHIVGLTKDAEKMRRLGLRKQRLLDAMFTSDTLPRLLQNWRDRPGQLDQSNLARFLVTVMSTETARKLAVAAAEGGFLDRAKSPYGTVLVRSTGVMEQIFGATVRDLRAKILASRAGSGA